MIKLLSFIFILLNLCSCSSLPKGASLPDGVTLVGEKLSNCYQTNFCQVRKDKKLGVYDIYEKKWILKPKFLDARQLDHRDRVFKYHYRGKMPATTTIIRLGQTISGKFTPAKSPTVLKVKLKKVANRYEGITYDPEEKTLKLKFWMSQHDFGNRALMQVRYLNMKGEEVESYSNQHFWLARNDLRAKRITHPIFKNLWHFKTASKVLYPDVVNTPESKIEVIGYSPVYNQDNLLIAVGRVKKTQTPVYGVIDSAGLEILPMTFNKIEAFAAYRSHGHQLLKTSGIEGFSYYFAMPDHHKGKKRLVRWSNNVNSSIAHKEMMFAWNKWSGKDRAYRKRFNEKLRVKEKAKEEKLGKRIYADLKKMYYGEFNRKKGKYCSRRRGQSKKTCEEVLAVAKEERLLEGQQRKKQAAINKRRMRAAEIKKNREYGERLDARRKAGARKMDREISARNARQAQGVKDRKWQRKMDYIKGKTLTKPSDY